MTFTRIKNASYPCVYNTWKQGDTTMVIQDLAPEDDEAALEILKEVILYDGFLSGIQKLAEDPVSVQEIVNIWRDFMQQRMSIGCYEEKHGQKTLVALNVCIVQSKGDEYEIICKGEKWRNINNAKVYAKTKANAYEHTGLDTLLHTFGLAVKREYRGKSLGEKIIAAREPLCLSQGIKGTVTLFNGIAAQKTAIRCGFQTIAEVSISELADAGLPYPRDDERTIKYMIKKYA